MFENQSYDQILARLLARAPDDLDTREGSVMYNALAPVAIELAELYSGMEDVLNEAFADTASRYYLVKRAAERGVAPRNATYATVQGKFNIEIPVSTRFSGGSMNYSVLEAMEKEGEYHCYKLMCETPGTAGNRYTGAIVPINQTGLNGLTYAEITKIIISGEDDEDTEAFRRRYLASIKSQAFGGNRADYIEKVTALPGVGGVKPYRAWNGGGTVKLVIVSSDFAVPTSELISYVQQEVDPLESQGEGLGMAPMDHVVTVAAAAWDTINIARSCIYETGYGWDDVKETIRSAVEAYLLELNQSWADAEAGGNIVVRVSHLESRILGVTGIKDVTATINGTNSNHQVHADSVVKLGTFGEVYI